MEVVKYRHSGELSDLTVTVEGQEFHLHKFPLFVRSNYFKSLKSIQPENSDSAVCKVTLEKFPGGAKAFGTVADYCYNKDVDINLENVIEVRCAAEYLQMTNSNSTSSPSKNAAATRGGGLATLADNVLFELLYTAKSKRDFTLPLVLLDRAEQNKEHANGAGLKEKLLESFAENLNSHVRLNGIYDNLSKHGTNSSESLKSLHNLTVGQNHLTILNILPLDWMNDLVKHSARIGLNTSLLSHMVQNYIEHNTGLKLNKANAKNDASLSQKPSKSNEKPANLINVASSILKAETKLSNLAQNEDESNEARPGSLINIFADIIAKDESKNADDLSKIDDGGDTLAQEAKPSNLITIASNILEKENDENKPSNLINIALDVKKKDDAQLEEEEEEEKEKEKEEQPKNLINIAGDILKPFSKIVRFKEEDENANNNNNINNKLETLKTLFNTLNEVRIDPQFSLAWLLNCMNELQELNADDETKAIVNKWAWNALNNCNSDSNLSNLPASVVAQFVDNISEKANDHEMKKLNEMLVNYMIGAEENEKLDLDTFIRLANSIPKSKRNSHDKTTLTLLKLANKFPDQANERKRELLSLIEFDKLNETTLEECKNNDFIPARYVAEAALDLCAKLRKELDEYKLLARSNGPVSNGLNHHKTHYDYASPISPSVKATSSNYNSLYNLSPSSKYSSSIRKRPDDTTAYSNKCVNIPVKVSSSSAAHSSSKPLYKLNEKLDDCDLSVRVRHSHLPATSATTSTFNDLFLSDFDNKHTIIVNNNDSHETCYYSHSFTKFY